MKMLPISNQTIMSSLDFLNNIINPARKAHGERAVRNPDFVARIEDEIGEELNNEIFVVGQTGHRIKTYTLTMEQMMLVGMRESKAVRRAVLAKLKEMESPKIPQTFAEALRLAAEQAEQLALTAPKAEVFDRIVQRGVLMTATQVGQKISLSAIKLNQILSELSVYNRSVKRAKAFQQWFIDKGFGEMKQTEQGYSQPLFTNAGEMWVVQQLKENGTI